MFSRIIKNFFLKRTINKRLEKHQLQHHSHIIKSIGIVIDETYFKETSALIDQLVKIGFKEDKIEVLHFLDKNKKNLASNKQYIFNKDISWSGIIKSESVNQFVNQNFDLLINYYDIEKPALLLISKKSKANFKVGFQSIDKRVHHFMVNLPAEQYKDFVIELYKYLKILKKI